VTPPSSSFLLTPPTFTPHLPHTHISTPDV
jgi:hypothetical protein